MAILPVIADPNILTKYIQDKQTLILPALSDPRDRLDVEVGDRTNLTSFIPQVKFLRWDNEVNYSARVETLGPGAQSISIAGGKISISATNYRATFYDMPDGYEFEVVLLRKPPVNSASFSLVNKGVVYAPQGELTIEEVAEGCIRPPEVVGSYAVYRSLPAINRVGGKLYRVGKVGHIYRPKAIDANRNWTWCELNIANGLMVITVPWFFLNAATYPVIIDPTFGYDTAGASSGVSNSGRVQAQTYAGAAGTLTRIDSYCTELGNLFRLGLYVDSSGLPGALADGAGSDLTAILNTWVGYNTAAYGLSAVDYWIAHFASNASTGYSYAYDNNTPNPSRQYADSVSPGAMPDPYPSPSSGTGRTISFYATYTAGGQAQALAGTTVGTATVSGALSVARPLAGTSNGAATATGSLTIQGQAALSGASSGVATASGALSVTRALSGATNGAATTTGDLTVAHTLAGTSNGVAAATGSLNVSLALSGASSGTATATGSLDVAVGGQVALSGTSTGGSTSSGALGATYAMGGTSDGAATASGRLALILGLSGGCAGQAAASGALRAILALSGAANGVGTATGSLTGVIPYTIGLQMNQGQAAMSEAAAMSGVR